MPALDASSSTPKRGKKSQALRSAGKKPDDLMEGLPAYSTLEVAKHVSAEDAWVIIGGKVLNVSTWLHEHPGGDVILLDQAGRDATREFEDVGHSGDARVRLDELVIGTVRPATDTELRISHRANRLGSKIEGGGVGEKGEMVLAWAQDNLSSLKKVGAVGVAGAVVVGVAIAVQRYAYRGRR